MNVKLITAPTAKPVSIWDARDHLRITTDDEDSYINDLIDRATSFIDGPYGIGMAICTQTWELALERFCNPIKIPIYPAQSITSITYIDSTGAEQTLSTDIYTLDTYRNPQLVALKYNQTWPTAREDINGIKVRFVCGYVTVPADIKQAVLMLVGHWYQNREVVSQTVSEIPMAVESILNNYRLSGIT